MENIKIYKKVDLKAPVMIAGWPGMGNVALGAVDYLHRKLKAVRLAEIELDPMNMLDSVAVEEGMAKFPKPPSNTFSYSKNPDIIIFEGEAQPHGRDGIALLEKVIQAAIDFKVRRIYTGAAFPMPVGYKEASEVYAAWNKPHLKDEMTKYGIKIMEGGHISGLNGLTLGFAAKKNIEAVCLLATMPQYAISLPNPKASYAIIESLMKMVGFSVDMKELGEYAKDMDEKMALIEDRVKDVLPIEDQKREPPAPETAQKVPPYIVKKIEKLFREAKVDKSKAIMLKKELDRWDLYKVYEDKFLDLFKENQ